MPPLKEKFRVGFDCGDLICHTRKKESGFKKGRRDFCVLHWYLFYRRIFSDSDVIGLRIVIHHFKCGIADVEGIHIFVIFS